MTDYAKLAAQLGTVRRAWKRRRMLAGLAIVLLESIGIFTVLLLADWLYKPAPAVRVVVFALALAAVAVLLVKHIFVHLVRKIPDEQLALYVEEHRNEFQGALMTAAEFGRGRDFAPGQARLIAAVLDSAAARASHVNLPSVVSLRRFRKYGWAAAGLLAVYAGVCFLFPQSVGHHAARVLAPWRVTAEDLRPAGPAAGTFEEAMKQPVVFALSRGDARVARGGTFELEAVLSRPSGRPVVLHFRPVTEGAAGAWRDLAMKEVDKLNGFAAALRDVSEDLQFYVSTETYATDAYRLTVYDPLALAALELTTRFPEYLKLPDRVETASTGDVSAPVGSTVTVRFVANNALAAGSLRWEGQGEQGLRIGDPRTAAVASFEVRQDAAYAYRLRDVDGQELAAAVPCYVRALKDQPPTLEVKFPRIDVTTHPLGQMSVLVEAADDFGVAGADFVYQLAAENAPAEARLPLKLVAAAGQGGGQGRTVAGAAVFMLEDVRPAFKPGDLVTYHLEARDQKGQKAISDIYMITVTPFEQWATWGMEYPEFGTHGGFLSSHLSVVLAAVWHLHTQKDTLPVEQFAAQSEALAKTMVDPSSGEVFPFVKMKKVPLEKKEHGLRVIELAKKAHAELVRHDTGKAVEYLRLGVAELAIIGLSEEPLFLAEGGGAMGGAPPPKPDSAFQQIAMFMLESKAADPSMALGQSNFEIVAPEYRRELRKIEEAEKLQKKAQDLRRGEQNILERAVAMAEKGAGQPGGEQPAGQQPAGQPAGGGDSAAALARDQRALAEAAKGAAMDAKAVAGADPAFARMAGKMDEAARDMFVAAGKMGGGNVGQAIADVRRADDNLLEAVKSVQGLQMHSLEQALDLAQAHAERILRDQREVRAGTLATAEKLAGAAKPAPAQQRDLGRLAFRQGEIRLDTERLKGELAALREWVQKGIRAETAKGIEEAGRSAERHQIVQKMTNAAVELEALRARFAAEEQAKAETGVQAVLDRLREAAGTLASDYKSELVRAKFEADRVAGALARLGGKEGGAEGAGKEGGAQAGGKEGGAQAAGKEGGAEAAGKEGGAEAAGKEGGAEGAGKEGGAQAVGKEGGAGSGQATAGGGPLGPGERRELSQQAASDLAGLGRHLEARRFAVDEAGQIRKAAGDPDVLAKVLASDEAKREELLGVVRKVGSKLTAALEAKLEAERLKDFQREECPPQYRPLVNKYYELLSQTVRE